MKKLTNEIVRKSFSNEGYTIPVDWQYINSATKIPYTCPNEHNHLIIWTNWYKGKRCPYCSGNVRPTSKQVRDSFLNEDYTIPVDWQYINSKTKIPYTCPNGYQHKIKWSDWQQGIRCAHCAGLAKLTSKQVRKSFSNEGYTIPVDWQYINSATKIPYTCPNEHNHLIIWTNWYKGHRCPYCSGHVKKTTNQIKESFLNEGYIIPQDWKYVNNNTKIPYTCPNGHNHLIIWMNWYKGKRCRWCSFAKVNMRHYQPEEKIQLYFLRIYDWIHGKETFKYGITRNSVEYRFKSSVDDWGFKIEVIRQYTATVEQICVMEQSLLYEVKGNRTKWVPTSFGGSTECFDLPLDDALDIWNKIVNQ